MDNYKKCKECDQEVEIITPSNYDGPDFCPECRSVDCFEEIDEDPTPYCMVAAQ